MLRPNYVPGVLRTLLLCLPTLTSAMGGIPQDSPKLYQIVLRFLRWLVRDDHSAGHGTDTNKIRPS
jgi:hypothetical protein